VESVGRWERLGGVTSVIRRSLAVQLTRASPVLQVQCGESGRNDEVFSVSERPFCGVFGDWADSPP